MVFKYFKVMLLVILPILLITSSACVSKKDYEKAQAQLNQVVQEKSQLANEVARLNSESNELKTQLSSLNSQLSTLKDDLSKQKTAADGLRKQLDDTLLAKNGLESETKNLKSQLDVAARATADLNKKVDGLSVQVKTLETMVPRFTQPPSGWKKYQNDEWGYSVQIPANWQVFDTGEKDDVSMWEPGLTSSLYIQSYLIDSQNSLDWWTGLVKNQRLRQELSRSQIILPGGIPATVVLFKTTNRGNNKQGMYLTTLTASRFYYLRLLTPESEWVKTRAQLEQIVLNFVLF